MGELRTRKRGKKWEYSFEGARVNGKRKPISKGGFSTKAEALAAGTQAKAEYDNCGRVFTPSELSVADYMDYWLAATIHTMTMKAKYVCISNQGSAVIVLLPLNRILFKNGLMIKRLAGCQSL